MAGLQREKDDLQRDNATLLKKPFGFTNEKRPPHRDAPPCPGGGPSADSGGDAGSPQNKRKRGGQPGARSHKRVQQALNETGTVYPGTDLRLVYEFNGG